MEALNKYISEALIKKDTKIKTYNKDLLEDILNFFSINNFYKDYEKIKQSIIDWITDYNVGDVNFYLPVERMLNTTLNLKKIWYKIIINSRVNKLIERDGFNSDCKKYYKFQRGISIEGNENYLRLKLTDNSWCIVEKI